MLVPPVLKETEVLLVTLVRMEDQALCEGHLVLLEPKERKERPVPQDLLV